MFLYCDVKKSWAASICSYSAQSGLQTCQWGRCSVGQVTTWVRDPQPPGARLLVFLSDFFIWVCCRPDTCLYMECEEEELSEAQVGNSNLVLSIDVLWWLWAGGILCSEARWVSGRDVQAGRDGSAWCQGPTRISSILGYIILPWAFQVQHNADNSTTLRVTDTQNTIGAVQAAVPAPGTQQYRSKLKNMKSEI